ncbi:MAG TPA: response regulator [Candidatus Obscuribacterales bacterium]
MASPLLLIVEDNPHEQLALAELVRKFDYETQVVSSGEDAIAAIRTTRFAAILMDITLPEMDGYECTRRIRELEKAWNRHIPVIALTGRAQQTDRIESKSAGLDDYLCKPFKPDDLRRILLRWVYEPSRPNLKVLIRSADEDSVYE